MSNSCPFDLEPSWRQQLADELSKPYILQLTAFVEEERRGPIPVYPPRELVFNAFSMTPYDAVKVVIMGQDPYHGPGQAHGLSFSVPKGVAPPPSLKNIFKEIKSDIGIEAPQHGCLLSWTQQGVMLLNATLTVRHREPMSHHSRGWETFTEAVIRSLCLRKEPVAFILWGKNAQKKIPLIQQHSGNRAHNHLILKSVHPSPLSAHNGFFGCRHFSQINEWLLSRGATPLDWRP